MITIQKKIFQIILQLALLATISSAQVVRSPFQSMNPAMNATGVDVHSSVAVSFAVPMLPSSFNQSTGFVYGEWSGKHQSIVSYDQNTQTLSLTPSRKFLMGERVHCILTESIGTLQPYLPIVGGFSYKFVTEVLQGTGQFALQGQTVPSPSSPYAIAAGDFNGDGFIDCAVTQKSSSSVSIYLNNQRNGFFPSVNYTVGTSPEAIVVADLSGDGHPDIIIANRSSNDISIMTNNGAGIFSVQSFAIGKEPVGIAVADCNNDGALDLAIVTAADSMVRIVRYNNNTITTKQAISLSGIPSSLLLEDLNNDGYSDLAVTLRSKNKLVLFKNDSLGHFSFDFEYTVGSHPEAVIAYDAVLGSDGYVDLATINSGSNNISILKNDNTGRFQGPEHFDIKGVEPIAICGNDFDGDGDVDLAITNRGSNSVSIFINNGVGLPDIFSIPLPASPQSIAALDISGEYGILDLLVSNNISGNLSILRNSFISPPAPQLSIERDSIQFVQTALHDTTTVNVKLFSRFTATSIDSVKFSSKQYSTKNIFPVLLSSYDSSIFSLYFSPLNYGEFRDSVIIYSTAGEFTIHLNGSSPAPQLTLSSQFLDFGEIKSGDTSAIVVKLKNLTVNDLAIKSLSTNRSKIFHVSTELPLTLKKMDSTTVTVRFTPESTFTYTDTLHIICEPNSATKILPLQGKGKTVVGVVDRRDVVPSAFTLDQNFPNPFNPSTTIYFSIPTTAQVNISVYDINGKLMSQLTDGELNAGSYSVKWNGASYASGLYYYRMRAQSNSSLSSPSHVFVETKKLLLLK